MKIVKEGYLYKHDTGWFNNSDLWCTPNYSLFLSPVKLNCNGFGRVQPVEMDKLISEGKVEKFDLKVDTLIKIEWSTK